MSVGTLSLTNGSKSVAGASTTFTTDLSSGDFILFVIGGTTYTYPIISVQSDTALTLVDEFEGPTTEGVSYSAVPQGEMVSVPMELIYQSTRAIRGLNLDKDNWQQVYSSADPITVNLPDGSTFTGPSWLEVSRGIDATNLDAANQIADRMEAAETTVQTSADNAAASETNAAQSASDAANSASDSSNSASAAAASATQSQDSADSIGDAVEQSQAAAQTATEQVALATTQADRATTEANKLGNTNDFAAILDTIDIETDSVTFNRNVGGADAVIDTDFVTLGQLHNVILMSDDFAGLASLVPTQVDQLAFIRSHTAGTGFGGGLFKAVAGAGTADTGMTQAVNDSFHWERYIQEDQVDVTMFGAVPDGETDAIDAAVAMHNWSQGSGGNGSRLGVQFPGGIFAISSAVFSTTEIGYFRFVGKGTQKYGYFNPTRIVLIGDADSIALSVVARRTEIGSFDLYGQYDSDSVVRHFFKNTVTQGAYVRISNITMRNVGGRCFDLLDTLDCKFSQFYSSMCQDNLFRVLASGIASWDHSTAVELSNFNIQQHQAVDDQHSALFIPNCAQSAIWNGWIEHSTYPGNLTNGHWNINSLSMESTDNGLYLGQSRFVNTAFSNPNNAGIDVTTDRTVDAVTGEYITRSISAYEKGTAEFNTYGSFLDQPIRYDHLLATRQLNHIASGTVWYHLVDIAGSQAGQAWRIKCHGRSGFSSTNIEGGIDGMSYIDIQNRSTDTGTVTWSGKRNSGIIAVQHVQNGNNNTSIYIQVPQFTWLGFYVESNGPSRKEAGVHGYLNWGDLTTTLTDDDVSAITGITPTPQIANWGTRTAGIVADGDNNLLNFYTTGVVENNTTKMAVMLNGVEGRIPFSTGQFINIGHWRVADLLAATASLGDVTTVNTFTDQNGDSLPQQAVKYDGTNWRSMDSQHIVVSEGTSALPGKSS